MHTCESYVVLYDLCYAHCVARQACCFDWIVGQSRSQILATIVCVGSGALSYKIMVRPQNVKQCGLLLLFDRAAPVMVIVCLLLFLSGGRWVDMVALGGWWQWVASHKTTMDHNKCDQSHRSPNDYHLGDEC